MYTATEVLQHEYLEARCMLVEVAAIFDRYDRAVEKEGGDGADPRIEQLYEAVSLLAARNAASNRSERLLQLFSDPA